MTTYFGSFVDSTPARIDEAHMNQAYGRKITPVIRENLVRLKLLS